MTDKKNTVYEIAILARVTWNLHSLNNEGNIGNVVEPRTLKLADGTTTDGISGEMLKHIHATKMWELEAEKSKFCTVCQRLEPVRADQNKKVTRFKKGEETEATETAIKDCILCDMHGFLVQRPTIHRTSTAEFGWAVGVREQVHRDIHQHARHAVGFKGKGKADPAKDQNSEDETTDDNDQKTKTSQMIFSRPTRSGVYAIVSVLQPWRIGLNTIDYSYSINEKERKERNQLALRAYESMFLRTDGAMTSTRLPHMENLEGIILVSTNNYPVPVLSPLQDNYIERLTKLAEVTKCAFTTMPFSDPIELIEKLHSIRDHEPYSLTMPKV